MRLALALILFASPALAQAVTPPAPRVYDPAPWWMDKPVIPAIGYVWTEIAANRANAAATYDVVDDQAADATKAAASKVRALGQALEAYGADKVRITTTFTITPLYAQYKDKQGELNTNQRADKIERYQVSVRVAVEVRDVRLTERVYATLMAAKPSATDQVTFRLEPDNETRTQMFKLAVEDARRRALLASEAAGARLGLVRVIDPTTRACETDVLLAPAGRGYAQVEAYRVSAPAPAMARDSMQEITVTAQRRAQEVGLNPEDLRLPLQPPLQRLEERACVVFSLAG